MPPSHWQKPHKPLLNSTVAGQNVFGFFLVGGGGRSQLGRAKFRGSGGKPLKIFEIFIPEIAANASNFKN